METTEKQRALDVIKSLPVQATIEDAIERLCFIARIEEGLRQSDAGQLVFARRGEEATRVVRVIL